MYQLLFAINFGVQHWASSRIAFLRSSIAESRRGRSLSFQRASMTPWVPPSRASLGFAKQPPPGARSRPWGRDKRRKRHRRQSRRGRCEPSPAEPRERGRRLGHLSALAARPPHR